jgi:hypothetical protein
VKVEFLDNRGQLGHATSIGAEVDLRTIVSENTHLAHRRDSIQHQVLPDFTAFEEAAAVPVQRVHPPVETFSRERP